MPWLAFATVVIFVLGTLVFLAPTIANWFSQVEQAHRITELDDGVEDLSTTAREHAIEQARRYNTTLVGGAVVAANERIPQSAGGSDSADLGYDQLLRADSEGLMARIKIPVIGVDLPVYHGTDDATLEEGIGHLEGTALPVGGVGTRSVLTGHRGLATSELFTNLDKVQIGDTFTIEVFGEVLTYQVVTTEVVEPEDSKALYPVADRDLVTLVTCTPLGINSHRILVTGERILPTPQDDVDAAGNPPTIPGFPWWMVILGAVLVLATVYVYLSGRPRRLTRSRSAAVSAPRAGSADGGSPKP
ncbi:class C sortase [Protaetiibacter intestinalis]|uniref:Class C sortase n=2 Tax=Protaetiibacter intestinalis TaxID=2419774 RepID=A0A387B8Q1_9MICO|nr:class C sortase [Protaetiibacter intestinalis]